MSKFFTVMAALLFLVVLGIPNANATHPPIRLRVPAFVFVPDRATPLYSRLYKRVTPQGRFWVTSQALRLREGAIDPSEFESVAQQGCMTNPVTGSGCDVEALCFLVLMQATAGEEQDLRAQMNQIRRQAAAKAQIRGMIQHEDKITASDINASAVNMKNQLDSESELGETESLRLQMSMDRLSKLMTTLSNVLKKLDDTGSSIVQNVK